MFAVQRMEGSRDSELVGSPHLAVGVDVENNWDAEIAAYSQAKQVAEKRERDNEETKATKKQKMEVTSVDGNYDVEPSDDNNGSSDDDEICCEDEGNSDDAKDNKEGINKQRKRSKKKKRRKPRKSKKHQKTENELKGKAVKLIEGLSIHLTKHTSPKISRNAMGIYQSKSFQLAVQHLITKDPVDQSSYCDVSDVTRVMFVWLSSVSAEMFLKDPSAFTNLSRLPSYPFIIMHPGSKTFCGCGCDAFLTIKTDTDYEVRLKRTKCILSLEDLKENDYPIKCSCHDNKNLDQVVSSMEIEEGELDTSPDTNYWCLCGETGFPEVTDESPMFAIDCEMVSTVQDNLIGDIARVSVVNEHEECVYDTFVKPYTDITDYRTKYSGITEELLHGVTTTLADVKQKFKQLIPADAILVGQSLENDFRSLKLFHPYVIDTSLLFTNNSKYKPKLRTLAQQLLKSTIQASDKGHSPIEDALTCMQLVQLKLKKGCTTFMMRSHMATISDIRNHGVGLFQVLASRDKKCAFIDRHANALDYSQGNIHSIVAETDSQAVKCAQSTIQTNDVVWLKLHCMQDYLTQPGTALSDAKIRENLLHQEAVHIHTESDNAISLAASREGASKEKLADIKSESRLKAVHCLQQSIQLYQDAFKQEAVNINKIIKQLDSNVYDLIRACPKGTLVFIICGSSHVDRIPLLFKASKHCPSDQMIQGELQRVVQEAREGLVLAHFTMHNSD